MEGIHVNIHVNYPKRVTVFTANLWKLIVIHSGFIQGLLFFMWKFLSFSNIS